MFNRAMTAATVLLLLGACASHHAAKAPAPSNAASRGATAGSGTSSPGISQSQARNMIEQDGYADVRNLRQTGDGGWSGSASANGKPVTVTVGPTGAVRAQ